MSPRSLVALLALLATIPVLSGCGGDDGGDGGGAFSTAAVAKAADATLAKGGSKIAIQSETTAPGLGKLTLGGDGAVNGQTQRGQLSLKVTDAPGLPATVDKDTLSQELVFDRFSFYIRSQAFAAVLKDGKKWLKLDLVKTGKAAGVDLSLLAQGGQDPTQSLRLLRALSGDVKKVGEEAVRGVQTTRYKGTIDLNRFPDTVPAEDRAAARATIDSVIKLAGSSTSPVEFWIGKDNLVHRYVQSLKVKLPAGGTSAVKQRIEFYDYGTKVDVTIPPADEVQDITDLAAAGLAGQTP